MDKNRFIETMDAVLEYGDARVEAHRILERYSPTSLDAQEANRKVREKYLMVIAKVQDIEDAR